MPQKRKKEEKKIYHDQKRTRNAEAEFEWTDKTATIDNVALCSRFNVERTMSSFFKNGMDLRNRRNNKNSMAITVICF